MKPLYFFLLFAFYAPLSYSQTNKKFAQDTIIWSADRPLTKEDFKVKKSSKAAASTSSGLFLHSEDKEGTLMFYVEAIFSKSKSFFMKEESLYTLKHEQLHFDITELHARKLRQKIIQRDFKKTSKVRETIQKMYDKAFEDCQREQSNYDRDTEHGINAAKQQVWSEKITQQLLELEAFSSTEIDIANK
jgi:hypothetical protein